MRWRHFVSDVATSPFVSSSLARLTIVDKNALFAAFLLRATLILCKILHIDILS